MLHDLLIKDGEVRAMTIDGFRRHVVDEAGHDAHWERAPEVDEVLNLLRPGDL
jgi:hypothetical protein